MHNLHTNGGRKKGSHFTKCVISVVVPANFHFNCSRKQKLYGKKRIWRLFFRFGLRFRWEQPPNVVRTPINNWLDLSSMMNACSMSTPHTNVDVDDDDVVRRTRFLEFIYVQNWRTKKQKTKKYYVFVVVCIWLQISKVMGARLRSFRVEKEQVSYMLMMATNKYILRYMLVINKIKICLYFSRVYSFQRIFSHFMVGLCASDVWSNLFFFL